MVQEITPEFDVGGHEGIIFIVFPGAKIASRSNNWLIYFGEAVDGTAILIERNNHEPGYQCRGFSGLALDADGGNEGAFSCFNGPHGFRTALFRARDHIIGRLNMLRAACGQPTEPSVPPGMRLVEAVVGKKFIKREMVGDSFQLGKMIEFTLDPVAEKITILLDRVPLFSGMCVAADGHWAVKLEHKVDRKDDRKVDSSR